MISQRVIRFVQEELRSQKYRVGKPDGKLGPKTEAGLRKALARRKSQLPTSWESWPRTRLITAYVQLRCRDEKVDPGPIDGFWGSQTDYAVNVIRQRIQNDLDAPNFRDSEDLDQTRRHLWPRQKQADVRAFFGGVGRNLTRLQLPYTHRLSWDKRHHLDEFSCHEKVHDSLSRILTNVLDHYGEDRIRELRLDLFGGCYNKRKKKGGTTWSMHAWGVAVDYDTANNRFHWGWEKASFARPEYDAWWGIWESEGWTSLGRARNFDWMHIQAPHL